MRPTSAASLRSIALVRHVLCLLYDAAAAIRLWQALAGPTTTLCNQAAVHIPCVSHTLLKLVLASVRACAQLSRFKFTNLKPDIFPPPPDESQPQLSYARGRDSNMRLLDTFTGNYAEKDINYGNTRYAILSHTWDGDEQIYGELRRIQARYLAERQDTLTRSRSPPAFFRPPKRAVRSSSSPTRQGVSAGIMGAFFGDSIKNVWQSVLFPCC